MKRKRTSFVLSGRKSQLARRRSAIHDASDELCLATPTPAGRAVEAPRVDVDLASPECLLRELHQAGDDWARVQRIVRQARRAAENVQIMLLDHVVRKL